MMKLWHEVAEAVRGSGRCAVVTVAEARGSAPREAGARLLVMPDGGFRGTIGGGALEWEAIAAARRLLQSAGPWAQLSHHTLGAELAQCCGGTVRLLTEIFDQQRSAEIKHFAACESQGPFFTEGVVTPNGVLRNVAERDERPAAAPSVVLELPDRIGERFGQLQRKVLLFGAGHVGRALMLALAPLPFQVVWIDSREDPFPAVMPANVEPRRVADPAAEAARAPDGAFAVVMTHSHPLDLRIVHAALTSGRFEFVGLIGSDTKRARFTKQLQQAGVAQESIDELVCPIGIEGIDSKEPAAIAVSVAAQLMAQHEANRLTKTGGRARRRGSSGRPAKLPTGTSA